MSVSVRGWWVAVVAVAGLVGSTVVPGVASATTDIPASGSNALETGGLPAGASVFVPVTPCRLVDTRQAGGRLISGTHRTFRLTGSGLAGQGGTAAGCGIPTNATSVAISATAVEPTYTGYFRAWATGTPIPTATFLNFTRNTSTTNTGPVPISTTGQITTRAQGGHTHLVIDTTGYYLPATTTPLPADASVFVPVTPCRLTDTRQAGGQLRSGTHRTFRLTGSGLTSQGGATAGCGIPTNATSVAISATAVEPTYTGWSCPVLVDT